MSRSRGSVLLGRVLQRGATACNCSYSHTLPESSALCISSFSTASARTNPGLPAVLNQFKLEAVRHSQRSCTWRLLDQCRGQQCVSQPCLSSRHAADKFLPQDLCQVKQMMVDIVQLDQDSNVEQREQSLVKNKHLMRSLTSTFLKGHWE